LALIGVRWLKDATSIVKLSYHNRPNKELFIKAGAHVSKPDSAVYKKHKKRAERTVDSDEEETKQMAKRMRCGTLRFDFAFKFLIFFP
jgi:hypothetical protein